MRCLLRFAAPAVAAAVLVASARPAAADTLVLSPASDRQVKKRYAKRVTGSVSAAVDAIAGARMAPTGAPVSSAVPDPAAATDATPAGEPRTALTTTVATAPPEQGQTGKNGVMAWQVGASVGTVIPRGDLTPGVIVGVDLAVTPRSGPLRLHASFDWMRLVQQDSTIVGPPDYPRARVDLIQSSSVFALSAGATYEIVELGPTDLFGGAGLGMTVNRSKFDAFNQTVPENDVGVLFQVEAGVRGPAGPMQWSVEVAWRETQHDLGDSGDSGESTMSGLVATAGFAYPF